MNALQYKLLRKKSIAYFNSLEMGDVKKEFSTGPLLNQNNKLLKGEDINYGLELTPSKLVSSFNMCGNEGSCLFTCLVFSGMDNVMKSKTMALSNTLKKRIRRTFLFLGDADFFITKLKSEIKILASTYKNLAIRLNVFSDVSWGDHINLSEYDCVFYDYTKRIENTKNKNIHFTFSASEKDSDRKIKAYLKGGLNIAVVFSGSKLPKTYLGFEVIDGDVNDSRYKDKKGVVIGLLQKTTIGGKTKSKFIKGEK